MVWSQLNVDSAHVAYAILGVFASIFSLVSLFIKEKLYIGEATIAAIAGLIVGPHCLNWFTPTEWGNTDYITLEISRVVLCLQIFAVAVELPKKYMLRHWVSVAMLLVPVMTWGWLVVGLFIYLLFPYLNFSDGLVVAACITATDPVLAAAVVGKGKFARRVPGHLRNVLSAESGCNDGMAFPFIYLGINLVLHAGKGGEIVKDWMVITILYECMFGIVLGVVIGYVGRHAIKFAERKNFIDRESFLAFYVMLSLICAGIGSILGVDDLLVSFAAGAAFSWDGWFARKTEETHVSTVIDLLLNLSYFVYFGAIIPWDQYNNTLLGLDAWRLIVLSIVILVLRRIPAVLALKPLIPDIKTWREALFCGHFGPIGVGAVYAAIIARAALEGAHTLEATPLQSLPGHEDENFYLIATIWPIVTFIIITSIIVHGSSVAVITLGAHLNSMAISMSFTKTNGNSNSASWISRLPDLKGNGRSFSLHRIDTTAPEGMMDGKLSHANTIETTGVPVRPAGGMHKKHKKKSKKRNRLSRMRSYHNEPEETVVTSEQLQREKEAKATAFALGGGNRGTQVDEAVETSPIQAVNQVTTRTGLTPVDTFSETHFPFPQDEKLAGALEEHDIEETDQDHEEYGEDYEINRKPSRAYAEGNTLIIEDQHGEIMESAKIVKDEQSSLERRKSNISDNSSILSPSKTIKRIISGERSKYTAFKMDNQLIIENEEGEVVRRYKINHHHHHHNGKKTDSNADPRARSSTLTKALQAVGLKTKIEPKQKFSISVGEQIKERTPTGMPQPGQPSEGFDDESFDEDSVSDQASVSDEDAEYDDDDDDDHDEDGRFEGETHIERVRRLTALGQVDAPRDQDDEEDTPVFQKH